jgi:hypothetical protein
MIRPGRDRLSGAVEVDETYVGGLKGDVHGRETLKGYNTCSDIAEEGRVLNDT